MPFIKWNLLRRTKKMPLWRLLAIGLIGIITGASLLLRAFYKVGGSHPYYILWWFIGGIFLLLLLVIFFRNKLNH